MNNVYKYQLFLKTVETGNITRTAEAFFVSQSAVSQQLKQLEDYFSKPLFYKDKTLKLTPFGHDVHNEIKQLISYYLNKENHIKQLSENDSTSVSIIGKTIFLANIVMPFIKNSKIVIRSIKNQSNRDICHAINRGKAHIGFGDLEKDFPNLEFIDVLKIPIVPIIHRNHLLSNEKHLVFSDIITESMILYDDSTYIGRKIQSFFVKEKKYPRSIIHANHSTLIRMLVEQENGIGFVYRHTIRKSKTVDYKILKLRDFKLFKTYRLIINRRFLSEEQLDVVEAFKHYFKSSKRQLLNL